ncbi:DUF2628 domain-containing protein [Terrihabitans rhizophilus]|uniref:DUF2628 domain-containing protein n=1 Tax=Terrihabitans rhizophilus TaxID=3092662 RepID=A0ABU4RPN5_9HYPH|nr:DUF2628 domain-containing protein [Terrihabitans sp. PJ23]MDX6806148.1 DUF2628 domain-containing protein [Terrihabitans sp. PJ23]
MSKTETGSMPARDKVDVERFLASDATRSLIGRKHEYYARVFQRILLKTGGDLPIGFTWGPAPGQRAYFSWNWAAALFPTIWLLYRRQYAFGFLALIASVACSFLSPTTSLLLQVCLIAVVGAKGNILYLRYVHRRWLALESPQAAPSGLSRNGGDMVTPIAAHAVPVAAAFLVGASLEASADFSCASPTVTGLATQIIREDLAKTPYVDAQATTLELVFVRTRSSSPTALQCAAELRASTVLTQEFAAALGNNPERMATILNAQLNREISYSVEETSVAGEIYVTLNQ